MRPSVGSPSAGRRTTCVMPFLSTAVMPCIASGARSSANLQAGDLADVFAIERRELVARDDQVVGDFRVDVLERIARLERRGGLVRAEVDQAAVTLVLDPHAARGIDGADVDRHEAAVRIDHLARDDDVDEIGAVRDDAHRAPLRGFFERRAQQRRHVARLGLAQIRIDALLGERLVVVLRDSWECPGRIRECRRRAVRLAGCAPWPAWPRSSGLAWSRR